MSETMKTNGIKTTDDAILFLKQLPGFACYHRYFETKLAGDFAFELAKFISKREAEIERLNQKIEARNVAVRIQVAMINDKDKLIEQMREALRLADDLIDEYAADYEHRDNVDEIREEIKAALSAAEGGE